MIFVFDCNSLSNILKHYYEDRFPSFWERFDDLIKSKEIISVREVKNELTLRFDDDKIDRLIKINGDFFTQPTTDELSFITKIYSITHFQQNLDRKKLLSGGYFADPFIIAKAWKEHGTVVTEEDNKPNAAKIPNICNHFSNIHCIKLKGFLTEMDWKF